jgi:hypothetical protein
MILTKPEARMYSISMNPPPVCNDLHKSEWDPHKSEWDTKNGRRYIGTKWIGTANGHIVTALKMFKNVWGGTHLGDRHTV